MKPLKLLMLEAANRGGGLLKTQPRKGYFNDVYRVVAPDVRKMIERMANIRTLEDVKVEQKDSPGELHEISAQELLGMCDQVRVLWRDLATNSGKKYRPTTHRILEEWWKHYPLTDSERWTVSYETRSFFPREMNFRALFATVLFENRTHMKTCLNCKRYFFGRRHDSTYCMEPDCQLAYNNERQKKHNATKKRVN